jgi:uncharacterized protein with HEPN domain
MLSEKESGALRDMLRHIDLAEQFAQGQRYESLRDDLQARHAGIPWREMAAAGNFYRHNYEDVTPSRVWKTLREELPPLRAAVDQELKRE